MSLVAVSISHENCLPLIKEENEQDKYKLGALEMFRLLFFFLVSLFSNVPSVKENWLFLEEKQSIQFSLDSFNVHHSSHFLFHEAKQHNYKMGICNS